MTGMPAAKPVDVQELVRRSPARALRNARVAFWVLLSGAILAIIALATPLVWSFASPGLTTAEYLAAAAVMMKPVIIVAAPFEIAALVIGAARLLISFRAGQLPTATWLRPTSIVIAMGVIAAPFCAWAWAESVPTLGMTLFP